MNPTHSIEKLLSTFDLKTFLDQSRELDSGTFLLRNKGNTNELNWYLAEQLKIYPKARGKTPEFVQHHCWFSSKSYEQASSEMSAQYKARLFSGKHLLDLSAGLGIDDWAFSFTFNQVTGLDPDAKLNEMVRVNFGKLNRKNIQRIDVKAEDFIGQNTDMQYDLIYLDADRRPESGKRFFIQDSTPDFLSIQDRCFEISSRVLLKLSPMVDLSYLKTTLKNIETILVLGDKQEMKEILVSLHKDYNGEIETKAVLLLNLNSCVEFSSNQFLPQEPSTGIQTATYFFEPHVSIIKAGLSEHYARFCGLNQLAPNSHFYTGPQIPANFMGRSFVIKHAFEFSKNAFQNYLKKEALDQANITTRNFIVQVDAIRKTYKIKEGGKAYLFLSTRSDGTRMVYHCQKLD